MQHVSIVDPLGDFGQAHVMSDMVAIGLEVHIDDACLPACHRLGHALHGGVRRPFRAIAIRARLNIRLKNGLEDQLQGSLHHTVAESRNPEDADLCPAVLWYVLPSHPPGLIRACDQFVPSLLKKRLYPTGLAILQRYPVKPWGAVVGLGHSRGLSKGLHCADLDVQAPEPPGRFSLRLPIYPPLQVLQTHGRLCHLAPASLSSEEFHTGGSLGSTGTPPLLCSYGPLRLPRVFG